LSGALAGKPTATDDLVERLRGTNTFLPLRDARERPGQWFISALKNDSSEPEGEARNLVLPSAASYGRVLCVAAPPGVDATYALAWRDALPRGAALRPGLAFVSESFYDYRNPWHGLAALAPFVSWHTRSGCAPPARWPLFQNGAARSGMSGWLTTLAQAATGAEMVVEPFATPEPVCFEMAVVFRRNMEGLSKERLRVAYDFMRCKARAHCGVVDVPSKAGDDPSDLRVTLLFRSGTKAFKDEAAVTRVFEKECAHVAGCAVTAVQEDNLTFCDRVRLLSDTDVLISSHGAQMTNLLFMEPGSSIMEFYPKGWRERAGGGQFVYRWMAAKAGMRHEGSWWDPDGEPCPGSDDVLSCYKDRQIGMDADYFAQWAAKVFTMAKERKKFLAALGVMAEEGPRQAVACSCN
ncbi:hypothetical protein EJB05_48910, partial [Eragrostis curvula]